MSDHHFKIHSFLDDGILLNFTYSLQPYWLEPPSEPYRNLLSFTLFSFYFRL